MTTKTLIRGGTVVSMDPQIGDLTGDVLIEDDKIVAVEPNISADAEVIDATGSIVIPGFVDTHRHTWEAAIRGCAPNATLDDYFVEVLDTFAPVYRPEDVYASNLAGSLECLNAGITTLVDWSHINNTPDHPDAAIKGLQETGIRALYAYGSANLSLADYWFNSTIAIPAMTYGASGTRTSPPTTGYSPWGWRPAAAASAWTRWCRRSGKWRASWAFRSRCTSRWAGWPAGSRMIKQLSDSGCSGPTPPTSTAATSATRSGSWSRTPAARSPWRRR